MAIVAANLAAAMANCQAVVQHFAGDPTENLYTQLALWEQTFLQFNDDVQAERTVRNWKVPTQKALQSVPNAAQDQSEFASDVFLVVYGATCAAYYANQDGRITAGQAAQVLVDWNAAWSF